MCGSSWPVVALCPGGGCVCAGMGAGPGCAAGAGDAEAVSESVVELSEDVDVMDVSGLSAKQNRGSDQGGKKEEKRRKQGCFQDENVQWLSDRSVV